MSDVTCSHLDAITTLAKLYTIVAPNYAAVIESYQKAQDVIKQQKK